MLEDGPVPKAPPRPTKTIYKVRLWPAITRISNRILYLAMEEGISHAFPVVVSTRASRPMRPIRLSSFCRTLSLSISQLCRAKKYYFYDSSKYVTNMQSSKALNCFHLLFNSVITKILKGTRFKCANSHFRYWELHNSFTKRVKNTVQADAIMKSFLESTFSTDRERF